VIAQQRQIIYAQDVLDDQLRVQQSWVCLQNIFASAEVRGKLAEESASFDLVDKFFVKHMALCNKHRLLSKLVKPGDLRIWRRHKVALAQVQGALDQLLEDKRRFFPRFYFLSNEELLELLAASSESRVTQRAVQKCFDGIEQLLPFEKTKSVSGFLSSAGETVDLYRPMNIRSEVEQWFRQLEEFIRDSL